MHKHFDKKAGITQAENKKAHDKKELEKKQFWYAVKNIANQIKRYCELLLQLIRKKQQKLEEKLIKAKHGSAHQISHYSDKIIDEIKDIKKSLHEDIKRLEKLIKSTEHDLQNIVRDFKSMQTAAMVDIQDNMRQTAKEQKEEFLSIMQKYSKGTPVSDQEYETVVESMIKGFGDELQRSQDQLEEKVLDDMAAKRPLLALEPQQYLLSMQKSLRVVIKDFLPHYAPHDQNHMSDVYMRALQKSRLVEEQVKITLEKLKCVAQFKSIIRELKEEINELTKQQPQMPMKTKKFNA